MNMRPDEFCRCSHPRDETWKFCPECSRTIPRTTNTLDLATTDATIKLAVPYSRPGPGFLTFWVETPAEITLFEWEMSARMRILGEFCAAKLAKLGHGTVQYCAFPSLHPGQPMGKLFEWKNWAVSPGNSHSYLAIAPGPIFAARVRFGGTAAGDTILFFSREEIESKFECVRELQLVKFPTITGAPNPKIYDLPLLLHITMKGGGFRDYFYETEAGSE